MFSFSNVASNKAGASSQHRAVRRDRPGFSHNFSGLLSCRSWTAFVSLRKVRGLIVFVPFLKFIVADLATRDRRESSLLETCFASVLIWSRYFGSTTLSYSRE
jgi:hypothetical protein